ncbi:MAG: DUF2334 domain-containing protein [Myxococcales bacterium]|nr:DUF2334 domain-containing protein [Myxococcales bacterium]
MRLASLRGGARVHVSIHDVSPAWDAEVEHALALCAKHGLRPGLLVVPNFHGRAPLAERPRYAARLRGLQAEGHEIFLHGYFHRSRGANEGEGGDGKPTGAARFFAQRVVSAGEAEMSDVTRAEARQRLRDGARVLEAAGLTIDGFVPPAWSSPAWLAGELAELGVRYTEDHLSVSDPVAGTRRRSLVLNFASRTRARMLSTVLFCRAARPLAYALPTRVALHPGDMTQPWLRAEADDLLAWAARNEVVSARALLD